MIDVISNLLQLSSGGTRSFSVPAWFPGFSRGYRAASMVPGPQGDIGPARTS
jgi:hypothetical protein